MRKYRSVVLFICFFVTPVLLFSQNNKNADSLIAKAKANLELIFIDASKSYNEAQKIYTQAVASQNHEAELIAIQNICLYYDKTYNLKKLLETAELLDRKSNEYQMPGYQVYAKTFLFDIYIYNGLYHKAKQQLDRGSKILKKANNRDPFIVRSKVNLYNAYSNYYAQIKDSYKRLEYNKLAVKELEQNDVDVNYKKMLCINYSNLSIAYFDNNINDSAEYYALKSIAIGQFCEMKNLSFPNFVILGNIYQRRSQYDKALQYYYQAEQVKDYNNYVNINVLYNNMIDIYTKKNDTANLNQYSAKLEKLNLAIAENKNNSLSKVIDNMENKDQKKNLYFIIITTLLLVTGIMIITIILHKKKILVEQEKLSQHYFEQRINDKCELEYANLIEMIKNNDLAFFAVFQERFPNFSDKLRKINPQLIQSEIEFCALLKLNIPTKDIARYRFIEPKTVQNKKYIIRKKLNIPPNMDIYQWFGNL